MPLHICEVFLQADVLRFLQLLQDQGGTLVSVVVRPAGAMGSESVFLITYEAASEVPFTPS